MAFTLVAGTNTHGAPTTGALAYGGAGPSAGSLLIAIGMGNQAKTWDVPTDSRGNTWVSLGVFEETVSVWDQALVAFACWSNLTGGANTVQFRNNDSNTVFDAFLMEFTHAFTSLAQDGVMAKLSTTTGADPIALPSIATTGADDLLIHFALGPTFVAANAPWSTGLIKSDNSMGWEYRADVSANTYTPNFDITGPTSYDSFVVAIAGTTGGGTTVNISVIN